MAKKQTKKKGRAAKTPATPQPKDFLDMIAPAAVKFNTDHYILGGAYHCTLALRSSLAEVAHTLEQDLLRNERENNYVTDATASILKRAGAGSVSLRSQYFHRLCG